MLGNRTRPHKPYPVAIKIDTVNFPPSIEPVYALGA